MRFQFDANQEYQLRAIEAVARLFRGRPRSATQLEFAAAAVRMIKQKHAAQLVDGIRYERIGDAYEMRQYPRREVALRPRGGHPCRRRHAER